MINRKNESTILRHLKLSSQKSNKKRVKKAYLSYSIPLRDTIVNYWSSRRRREGERGRELI